MIVSKPQLLCLLAAFTGLFSVHSFGDIILSNGQPDPAHPGFKLWLKADTEVFNVADTILAGDGQSVTQWKNQIAGAAVASHATQATAANQPVFVASSINAMPAVRFDGADAIAEGDWLRGNFTLNATKTLFVVMRDTGTPTTCCSGAFSPNGNFNSLGTKAVGGTVRLNIDWGGSPNTAPTDILNQNTLAVLTWNTTSAPFASMYLNGTVDAVENSDRAAASTAYMLGARQSNFAGRFFRGDIAEVLAYDGELDRASAEHEAIGYYLANKYGITTSYIPEPSSALLTVWGLILFVGLRRKGPLLLVK